MREELKKEIKKEFFKAVEQMKSTHENGTYHWNLFDDNDNNWALVLGWESGYEENPDNPFISETYGLCAKIAYQSKNNIMQCDYDIDWTMPYNNETMEVDDSSLFLGSFNESDLDWLFDFAERYENKIEEDND